MRNEHGCMDKLDSVSHRLFLMLYFLKTAESYVKYTKTVVNEL